MPAESPQEQMLNLGMLRVVGTRGQWGHGVRSAKG
jgi:hypothetical protein